MLLKRHARPSVCNGDKTKLAEAIRYALSRWEGLTRYPDDGSIEIDSNVVERSIRPIALNRKNALFAASDGGGEHWASIASLIETCKLRSIEPHNYLADVITRIVTVIPTARSTTCCLGPIPLRWIPGKSPETPLTFNPLHRKI